MTYADRRRLFGRFKIALFVLAGLVVLTPRLDAWPFLTTPAQADAPAQQAAVADTAAKPAASSRS